MLTGGLASSSTDDKFEGDIYLNYHTFEEGGVTTFNKEQIGILHPDSGYQYLPSGDSAFATLGLRHVESQIQTYIERQDISGAATVAVKLYGFRFQTGELPDISGVVQTPLFETVVDRPSISSSGIILSGPSKLFKKELVKSGKFDEDTAQKWISNWEREGMILKNPDGTWRKAE